MSIDWTARTALADKMLDRARWSRLADALAVALAVSLPWSTSATGIIAALWLLVIVPIVDRPTLRHVLTTPAGGLPVLLWALGVAGLFWADAPWDERLKALGSFHKLLFIPLLMAQFALSDRSRWLMMGFLASCALLLLLSFLLLLFPSIPWPTTMPGIPVKNYAAQSELFAICAFLLARLTVDSWSQGRGVVALGCAALSLAFLVNIQFVATTRTALVVLPVLGLLFGFHCARWRGVAVACIGGLMLAALAWLASPHLQSRIATLTPEIGVYVNDNQRNSAGERLEFWKKSVAFFVEAPVIGHGTGAIKEQFCRAVVGESGASSVVSANPHNQTLAVAVQLGLVGVTVLFAMWAVHVATFGGLALTAWAGLVIVVQNIIGSLFNSQLFDFTQGWAYVIGVGVCGGAMLARRAAARTQ